MVNGQQSWAAYRAAVVSLQVFGEDAVVGPLEVIGETAVEFRNPSGATVHILTADNPRGQIQSDDANRAAYNALLDALADRNVEVTPAAGHDVEGTHIEASVAVTGLTDEEAMQLGRQFGQQAIFAWRPDSWDLIRCSDGAIESRDWGGVITSRRLDTIETLIERWQLEPAWVVHTEDGFSHWWHGLEQAVSRKRGEDGFDEWSATTSVVRDINDVRAAQRACRALNLTTAGFAYVFDEDAHEITVQCSFSGRPGWDQPYIEWTQAALASYWHADHLTPSIAETTGGEVALSAPPGAEAPRADKDSMLNYQQYLRARPEWVWGGATAALPPVSEFAQTMRSWIPPSIEISDASDESTLLLQCRDTDRAISERHQDAGDGALRIGEEYVVGAAIHDKEPFGPGLAVWVQWALPEIPGGDIDRFVNELNRANAARGTVNGTFQIDQGQLRYEIFTPAAVLASLTEGPSKPTVAQAGVGVLTHLGVVIPYVDNLGRVNDARMPNWPDVDEDAARYLRIFCAEALDALRCVPKPDPERADRRLLWAPNRTPLCHFGIFNPMGPTLNSLELSTDPSGQTYLLHLMRHPFVREYDVLGPVEDSRAVGELIRAAMPDRLSALPDFIWNAAPDELHEAITGALWDVFAATSENDENADTNLAWEATLLRHYRGRAWDRLNQIDDVPEPQHPYAGVEGIEYGSPIGRARDFEDWFYAASDPDNVWGTLAAYPSAWDGAINFQRENGSLGVFELD